MKISFLKYYKDEQDFELAKRLGIDIIDIHEPEQIDNIIENLKNEKYTTIIMPNELASFSNNIVSKYNKDSSINIIITPNFKRKNK